MIPERLRDVCSKDTCLRMCLCVYFVSFLRGCVMHVAQTRVCACDCVCAFYDPETLPDGRRKETCLRMCCGVSVTMLVYSFHMR